MMDLRALTSLSALITLFVGAGPAPAHARLMNVIVDGTFTSDDSNGNTILPSDFFGPSDRWRLQFQYDTSSVVEVDPSSSDPIITYRSFTPTILSATEKFGDRQSAIPLSNFNLFDWIQDGSILVRGTLTYVIANDPLMQTYVDWYTATAVARLGPGASGFNSPLRLFSPTYTVQGVPPETMDLMHNAETPARAQFDYLGSWAVTVLAPGERFTGQYFSVRFAAIPDHLSITDAVPEPQTWALMLLGFAGLGGVVRRASREIATS